jgi:hypothetical protein
MIVTIKPEQFCYLVMDLIHAEEIFLDGKDFAVMVVILCDNTCAGFSAVALYDLELIGANMTLGKYTQF